MHSFGGRWPVPGIGSFALQWWGAHRVGSSLDQNQNADLGGVPDSGPAADGRSVGRRPGRAVPPSVRPGGRHRSGFLLVPGEDAQHAGGRDDRPGGRGGKFSVSGETGGGCQRGRGRSGHHSIAPHDGGGCPVRVGSVLGGERSPGQDRISAGGPSTRRPRKW